MFIESLIERSDFQDTLYKIVNRAMVITAVHNKKIVGYCPFYMNDFVSNTVYITLIAVDKQHQGMQIGTNIMNYVKSVARLNGFNKIRLEVNNSNIGALRFYNINAYKYEKEASECSCFMVCNFQ